MGEPRLVATGRRTLIDAAPSHHLSGLGLKALRDYRQHLREEEEKISYWRRVVHARIDLLHAGTPDGSLSLAELVRVLGDTGSGRSREALAGVGAGEPLPDLPALADVWLVPGTEQEVERALVLLGRAEEQFTHYRSVLHRRIDEATGELISRYRADPREALSALTP